MYSVLMLIGLGMLAPPYAHAAQVTLSWNPSPSAGVAGYWVYYSEWSGSYTMKADGGKGTSRIIDGLQEGKTYYFTMAARDIKGNESEFSEELFYPGANIALNAQVTASSQYPEAEASKAVDGYQSGYPEDETKEWVAQRQLAGAWISLAWNDVQEINRIVLYDRPNMTDQILKATLYFSDGSSVIVGPLANDGTGTTVTFPPKMANKVTLKVNSAKGYEIGLSEIEVFANPM
jgi:hypothetical protein